MSAFENLYNIEEEVPYSPPHNEDRDYIDTSSANYKRQKFERDLKLLSQPAKPLGISNSTFVSGKNDLYYDLMKKADEDSWKVGGKGAPRSQSGFQSMNR